MDKRTITNTTCGILLFLVLLLPSQSFANTSPDTLYVNPFGAAPAYSEASASSSPKKIMIVIHGGAWSLVGQKWTEFMRPYALKWRKRGWETLNIDYRAGPQSVDDVLWFYDRAHKAWPKAVICAVGQSAGGHLALMLAVKRPQLGCALSEAGPVSLNFQNNSKLIEKSAPWNKQTQSYDTHNLKKVVADINRLFGTLALADSPIEHMSKIRSLVALNTSDQDPLIAPYGIKKFQKVANAHANMRGRVVSKVLRHSKDPTSGSLWVHTNVLKADARRAFAQEVAVAQKAFKERNKRN